MNFPYPRFTSILGFACLSLDGNAAEKITYEDHVFPIFESKCLNCHNPDKKKGDLDLSTYTGAMAGSSGGKIALAGDGGSSKLYTVTVHTEEPVMPPEGDKIAKKDSDMIRAWIDGGLLETKNSKARKRKKPAFSLGTVAPSNKRPEGPPPMPKDLLLDPVLVAPRGTVVNDMDASPWAPLLAVTGQRQILLYNTDTLSLVGILPFPHGQPETVSFHPGGKYLLAGGGIGGKSGRTIVWDVTNGEIIMEAGKEFDSVLAADLKADLEAVAMGGPSRLIKIWDTQIGEQSKSIKKHTDWVTALAYSHDGILLATGDRNNGIQVWEANTGNEFHSLRGHQKAIVDLKWRADSNLLASASEDGQVMFWDMNEGKQVKKVSAHGGGVLAMDYAPSGDIVTSGRDKKVKLWKPDLGLKKELPAFPEMITEVSFSHDAKRLFVSNWSGLIQVWDTATFKKIGTLESNPPEIATRLVSLEGEAKKSTSLLEQESSKTRAAQKALEAAKADLAQKKQFIADSRKSLDTLIKERDTFAEKWKQFDLAQKKKAKEEIEIQSQTKISQNFIREHAEQRRKLAVEQQQLRTEQQLLQQELTGASRESERARENLAGKPEDPELKEKLADAEQIEHGLRQLVQQFAPKFEALDKRIAEHGQAMKNKEDLAKLKDVAAKKLRDERNQLISQRDESGELKDQRQKTYLELKNKLPALEKALKPASDLITSREKSWEEAKGKVEAEKQKRDQHVYQIAFWNSAGINTGLISAKASTKGLKQKLADLKDELKEVSESGDEKALADLETDLAKVSGELAEAEKRERDLTHRYQESQKALH